MSVFNSIATTFKGIAASARQHSPEILIVGGIIGGIGTVVLACRATLKAEAVVSEAKENLAKIEECQNSMDSKKYSEEDAVNDRRTVYIQTAVKVAGHYLPAVGLGNLSLTGIIKSHDILSKRNVALAAAYMTVDTAFKEYRGRVREKFGDEVENQLRYGLVTKEIEEKIIDEKGKEKTVKKTVTVCEGGPSEYARFFDEDNPNYIDQDGPTMLFIGGQENYLNDLLRVNKIVYLNDVYRELGFKPSKAGAVVGWVYDKDGDEGDNYIRISKQWVDVPTESVITGEVMYEKKLLLDFNVDGPILDHAVRVGLMEA